MKTYKELKKYVEKNLPDYYVNWKEELHSKEEYSKNEKPDCSTDKIFIS